MCVPRTHTQGRTAAGQAHAGSGSSRESQQNAQALAYGISETRPRARCRSATARLDKLLDTRSEGPRPQGQAAAGQRQTAASGACRPAGRSLNSPCKAARARWEGWTRE
eukprot:15473008-Alexandrium_andersonii.AAC.1